MAQLFRPRADAIFRFALWCAGIGVVVALVAAEGLANSDYWTGRDLIKAQPVAFSHQHHSGELGIDCRYCHVSVEQTATAGMPPTHTCMTCHSQIWTNSLELAPVRESLASGTPLVWTRVYRLPSYTYFNHAVHVKNGIGCSSCHGNMLRMQMTQQANSLSMAWCLNCHSAPENFVRETSQIYDMQWTPPPDQATHGPQLVAAYHIDTSGRLLQCSTCHR